MAKLDWSDFHVSACECAGARSGSGEGRGGRNSLAARIFIFKKPRPRANLCPPSPPVKMGTLEGRRCLPAASHDGQCRARQCLAIRRARVVAQSLSLHSTSRAR